MTPDEGTGASMAQKTHPHAEATYRVIPFDVGSFAVEVSFPANYPTKVSKFATEADAEAWIAEHQRRVQAENHSGRWFRRPAGPRSSTAEKPHSPSAVANIVSTPSR
jgi:hypothetical protein